MGLFDLFKKKQAQPQPNAARSTGSAVGNNPSRQDTGEVVEAFDYAVDAMYRALDVSCGGTPLPPSALKHQFSSHNRIMDLPAIDAAGRMVQEIRGIIEEGSPAIWGGFDYNWSPETNADRFYDSFPADLKELERLCQAGIDGIDNAMNKSVKMPRLEDDVSLANTMYGFSIHIITQADLKCREKLPLSGCINGDPDGLLWSINDEAIRTRDNIGNPEISKQVNWLANINNDQGFLKKESESLDDGVFKSMIANLLDTHYGQIKKIFDRFSGYAQRVERVKETNVINYGLPDLARDDSTGQRVFANKLEEYIDALESHLVFGKIIDGVINSRNQLGNKGKPLYGADAYLRENYDFHKPSVHLPRVYGYLALSYLTDYAVRNMKSFYNFNKPKYEETIKGLHGDIMNYLSFKGYNAANETGMRYHALIEKMMKTINKRSETLFDAIIDHTSATGYIRDAVAPSLMIIARRHSSETQIRRGLNDAITRRMASRDTAVIRTQQANYFVPWSQKSAHLLEDAAGEIGSRGQ